MLVKSRFLFFSLLALTAWFCFSQENTNNNSITEYSLADRLYVEAERLSSVADLNDATELKQEQLNRQALGLFKKILSNNTGAGDSILFHCYVKAGLLEHYFDSLPQAKTYYLKALALKPKLPNLQDSFFFKPFLFAGSIFYSQNLFDSALLYYRGAEQIADGYKQPLEEMERLYNRMGVMHYETGNYRLANNYFQKALSILSPANPSYSDLLLNYKMNIASILIKMEAYEKADTIYRNILPFNIHLNEINHNIGIIDLRTGKFNEALSFFRKVNYEKNARNIDLYCNMAEVFDNLQQEDSSQYYINKAQAANKMINGNSKNASLGLLLKFIADKKANNNELVNAVLYYQQAICQFYPSFNTQDVYAVPENYTGVFSYIQLFNTLIAKGDALGKLYMASKKLTDLQASFNAYKSAFSLADYVARTYDSDEARSFLNKIKYISHDKAIRSSLSLYEITAEKKYLEEAYFFDQRNKASSLTLALQENNMQKEAGLPVALLSEQANLRSGITRLSLKANRITDSIALAALNNEIRDNEIRLAKIQGQINDNPNYSRLQPGIHIPPVASLQHMLDDKTTLLSYHLSSDELLVFTVSANGFDYVKQKIDSSFFKDVQFFISSLHSLDESQRYNGEVTGSKLFQVLIKPLLSKIGNCTRLIIIPDDELNYVAFEALQDEQNKYLLQSFSVQYQYTTALLQLSETNNRTQHKVLAFAPFTGNSTNGFMQSLPYSKNEVAGLDGKIFIDSEATKQHFIEYANKYSVVQLATHAAANDSLPQRSYIAFYPAKKDNVDENILYAQEIYDLRLDSINLVILSACETGTGKLVRGEGLMSMSRAFAYAGCPNIITSLWKASDKTTAFITQRLHIYLDKGYNKDRSLQLAKLDLLNSNEIPPALKTPNYWAHLILIGNYEPVVNKIKWYWIATGFIFLLILYLMIKKRSRKNAGQ